jgi:hypothetical protein
MLAATSSNGPCINDRSRENRSGGNNASKEKGSEKKETLKNVRVISRTVLERPLEENIRGVFCLEAK